MSEATRLDGKVAIVTGAGRGLGRVEALELAKRGAKVVVNDVGATLTGEPREVAERPGGRDSAEGASPADVVVAEIADLGGEAVAHHGDVADTDDAKGLVRTAIDTFGDLDILVNNAGIIRDRMLFSMSDEEWDAVVRVHLRGHFATCRAATSYWRDRSKESDGPVYARIVNTSSEAFLIGSPGQPNYSAAKSGIVGLTMSIANSCGKYGVRANVICPRARTRMTAEVFGAQPEDDYDPIAPEHVAPLVAFLSSPAAEAVSGQVFVVHGGYVGLVAAPSLEQRFDAESGHWEVEALAAAVGRYWETRDPKQSFAAIELLKAGGM